MTAAGVATHRFATARLWAPLRDKWTAAAVLVVVVLVIAAVFGEWIAPYDPRAVSLADVLLPPTLHGVDGAPPHLLGTDPLGRDVLSRIIAGARISLVVGVSSVVISGLIGTAVGLVAGTFGGKVDSVLMRLADLQLSLPTLLLALLVLYVLGQSIVNLVLVFALTRWSIYARVVRGIIVSLRERPFVEAAQAMGTTRSRLIRVHMLRHTFVALAALAPLELASVMVSAAGLSFLGLGVPLSEPDWGAMLSEGRQYATQAWWLLVFPGAAIMLSALAFNLIGRALEEGARTGRGVGMGFTR